MKLVAGLGNPGVQYEGTRHNVGFMVLERLARRYAPGATARGKFHGAIVESRIENERVFLLKPLNYMNRSGQSVVEAVQFYKIDPAKDLLVIVDDLALPCGSIRLRAEGSAGGHNGLLDIEQKLNTMTYPRLRIGIDSAGSVPSPDYVTGRFRPDQWERVEPALEDAVDAAVYWSSHGIVEAMNRFNRKSSRNEENAIAD